MDKEIIKILFSFILITLTVSTFVFGIDLESKECNWSEHNIFTNMTGGTRFFGNCYIPINDVYQRTQKCGFLGISCYETEPYGVNERGSVCFKLRTGELCK